MLNTLRNQPLNLFPVVILLSASVSVFGAPTVVGDAEHKTVTLTEGDGRLTLRLNYKSGCFLDRVEVLGRNVAAETGAGTGIRLGDEWLSSRSATGARVKVGKNMVIVTGISFGQAGQGGQETWKLTPRQDRIVWQITRSYPSNASVADMAFPEWNFSDMSAWTGGMLDNGGVVWNKYLDRANATYGGHFGTVTFWNSKSNDCLRITSRLATNLFGAGRFSRQGDDTFLFRYAISNERIEPAHGQSRFLRDRQDLWKPYQVRHSEVAAEFVVQAFEYDKAFERGTLAGLDGNNVRELLNTVARYGVIDSQLVGGNGWRSGYICLHEPFFAQIAAAVDAPDYTANLAAALDYARDHAIESNGRVKSRWCYGPGDAMRGTYDEFGFYEAQWGYLMDSQPDYVINVVEEFYLTGDRKWLASHKAYCERALDFLTRREVGHTGLVTMMTDSHQEHKGSDWVDIIWASYENALINAELYAALNLWADAEKVLDEPEKAASYGAFAAKLKGTFNRSTSEGGFWSSTNQWYVYWRDKDGSIHGDNLVTPVNFAAIAYGLCDEPARRKPILERIEEEMEKEKLFYWPLNLFPYDPEEGAASNFPFPKYENGDIFLSWGELGVRAYAAYNPELALKYVKNTLDRYAADGLSFQRYLRSSQRGAGDDILAGNCMPIVGLYRDLYGIIPKWNRLCLEPHLPRELNGTKLRYEFQGRPYEIGLSTEATSVSAGNCTICDLHSFAISASDNGLQYFPGTESEWAMSLRPSKGMKLTVQIVNWPCGTEAPREWTESCLSTSGKISHVVKGLKPGATYQLYMDGKLSKTHRADKTGQLGFEETLTPGKVRNLRINEASGDTL